MTNQKTENRAPVGRFINGNVQASLWSDKRQDREGNIQDYWTIILDKAYRDASGNWKYGRTLGARDLTHAIFVLQQVNNYIMEQQGQKQINQSTETMPEVEVEAVVG